MTSFLQSKHLAVVAASIWATTLAASPTAAQQPDSATINGTIGWNGYELGLHTWTLTLQGLTYSYDAAPSQYTDGSLTRVYATSFGFEFQGPHAAELNANVSHPLVNSGLQDGPVIELIDFMVNESGSDWYGMRECFIQVQPSDYQQGLYFWSHSNSSEFATGANGYPLLAPFTAFAAETHLNDRRSLPDDGYSMGTGGRTGTVSVSAVGFSLPGDYNRDGAVDAADYVAWRKSPSNFGGEPGGYNNWRTNFGRTTSDGLAASENPVPEPISLALLTLVAPALLRRRQAPAVRKCGC
jgi:hypothetical protein